MSWWNAKYKNNHGEYEITFASKDYEKTKAVEKVCCAVIDKVVKSPFDVEVVVRCRECKFRDGTPGQPNILCGNMHDDDFCSYGERKEGTE